MRAAKENVMVSSEEAVQVAGRVLDRDEIDTVLSGAYYAGKTNGKANAQTAAPVPEKPAHYKVICISMYTRDLEQLDAMVVKLKGRGLTKANRSALIRFALAQVDIEKVPRGL